MPGTRARLFLCLSLAGLSVAQAAESPTRFHPASDSYVVLESATSRMGEGAATDSSAAAAIAERYLSLARSARDPRYFGRAEATLKPWISRGASPRLQLLQADIQQNRHDFEGALQILDRVIAADPAEPRAHLMRATLLFVRGDSAAARRDCTALMGLGQTAIGTVCLAQSMAGTGQLPRAITMIELVLDRGELIEPSTRAWALTSLADMSARCGNSARAETLLRDALEATPQDESIRSALIDVSLARGKTAEALSLSDLPRASVGLLVRRLLAQIVIGDAKKSETLAQLQELLRLEAERNERVHLREETLLALGLGKPASEVVRLARANFAVQRETIDARLLARAASNAGDAAALGELREWCAATGFRDRLVDALLGPAQGGSL